MLTGLLPNGARRAAQRGVGMIEVLVALVVLAIGLLATATLQNVAMRENNGAYLRSQATVLAYDIADRMRANRDNAGDYQIALGDEPPSSPSTRAGADLQEWFQAIYTLLPEGDGAVQEDGDNFEILVTFDATGGERAPVEVVMETQP